MKKIFLFVGLAFLVGILYGLYMYYKKPPDTHDLTSNFKIKAQQLINEYDENEEAANKKYLDKIIEVDGVIGEIITDGENPTISLSSMDPLSGVSCSFYSDEAKSITAFKIGDSVVIKGKCTGKLMDVVLNNCIIQH